MHTGLESFFSSKSRVRILNLFILNPQERYYLREICKAIGLSLRSVQRELKNLEHFGLLEKTHDKGRVFYRIKTDFFLYQELKNIILKTTGLGNILKGELTNLDDIAICFIYGSYAKDTQNTQSDIDLFFIGKIKSRKLYTIISKVQNQLKREIKFVNYSASEIKKRRIKNDHFITAVLKEPKIFIIGDDIALQKIT